MIETISAPLTEINGFTTNDNHHHTDHDHGLLFAHHKLPKGSETFQEVLNEIQREKDAAEKAAHEKTTGEH